MEFNQATTGMNMDNSVNQVAKGMLTYALNASVENFDSNSVNYQNEPGNEWCLDFPTGFHLIGTHFINEQNKHIFFLTHPETGDCQIGYMDNNDCIYRIYISAPCLNFNINYPILKSVHKITNCTTEVYWTDGLNSRRFIDLTNLPYTTASGNGLCDSETLPIVDCNKLKIQPNFSIPELEVTEITTGGDLTAGTYQFAIQYCDSIGDGYTSYYSVTNPTPIANTQITTLDFNYQVGRSIVLNITNIDVTGYFRYFNLAVIKTINNITSVELAATYFIDRPEKSITYTGQNQEQIKLTTNDIFEKFPFYDVAQDVTSVRDILIWDNLQSVKRVNYQKIANSIKLYWQTYKMPSDENYSDGLNATNLRGYLRDEVYAFEIVFLLKNGKQTDGFHIPGRVKGVNEIYPDIPNTDPDFIGTPEYYVGGIGYSPYWKIYNTASVLGPAVGDPIGTSKPHEYGDFAYWESTETYPCNEFVWGELANQPIRHHKFPDVLVSPIFETPVIIFDSSNRAVPVMTSNSVYPIGVRVNSSYISLAIAASDLTQEEKEEIVGFKIVRGDRATNKSIVGKGILRNVGSYNREKIPYYYPNYPYNDTTPDPFILSVNNAFISGCQTYRVDTIAGCDIIVRDCITDLDKTITIDPGTSQEICSLAFPILDLGTFTFLGLANYQIWTGESNSYTRGLHYSYVSPESPTVNSVAWSSAQPNAPITMFSIVRPTRIDGAFSHTEVLISTVKSTIDCGASEPVPLNGFDNEDSKYRLVFNSPETSFGQPFLGGILKLENVMFGAGRAHFVEVRKHAFYKLITKEAQQDAIQSAADIVGIGAPDITAIFTAYQAYLTIYINGITRKNYAYSFNSIASYDYGYPIDNNIGIKQRPIDLVQYLIPGVQSVGDNNIINNFNRESSVYIKTNDRGTPIQINYNIYEICYNSTDPALPTGVFYYTDPVTGDTLSVDVVTGTCESVNSTTLPYRGEGGVPYTITITGTGTTTGVKKLDPLPFPSDTPSLLAPGGAYPIITDKSRFTISSNDNKVVSCTNPTDQEDITVVSYYASLKNEFVNQWGQIYSYNTIDTGLQKEIDYKTSTSYIYTVFGGDTFISRFAFKTKLPFFIDNRVGAPDDSDVFYDEIGNIAYPRYWFSSRSILSTYTIPGRPPLINFISYKAHNFDCPNSQAAPAPNPNRTFYDGKMYLFAYGIPNFYCETSINTNLRQAFNNREGDFWPHVSTDIPDEWFQESFVTIAQDNTYYYNVTFSKQNKENFFAHLPVDWADKLCYTQYPFRAIYSDTQQAFTDNVINNWLIYRPISFFDFPQNYGKLTSLDGIQNKSVLARFENKSLLYNTLLTIDTSNPQAAYIGNDSLFKSAPPIDFAETDLGYVGSQNKMLLKIPQGQVTIDAKRGQVFLIEGIGGAVTDLSAFGSGMNRFFTDHLAFEILRYFPKVNTDNHFNGVGLHGVYDSKYDRVIISKLDYIPLNKDIKYDEVTKEFYIETSPLDCPPGSPVIIRTVVYVTDSEYFCNKSWTLSFNMNTKTWISFHSYIPNWYIAENNFFYSGLNGGCDLEAIAAEEVAYTTTSTTTLYCPGCQPPVSTTSTTTIAIDCRLLGTAVIIPTTTTSTSTTSTTTTTNPNCKCLTFTNNCTVTSIYSYINCAYEIIAGTLEVGEVLTVCGYNGLGECEGVVIVEGSPCSEVITCLSPEQLCVQDWSKHNLAVTTLNDSTPIAYIAGGDPLWASTTSPAYCCPNDDCSSTNIAAYGYLYNHYAVETGTLAPLGYHIPTDAEWTTLIDCLGGAAVAGDPLKSVGTDFWNAVNTGTNTSGFSAVGAAARFADGTFSTWNKYGNLWSSDGAPGNGNYVELQYDLSSVSSATISSNAGMSVRLVKD